MTAIVLKGKTPADQAGVVVEPKLDGYTVSWTPQSLGARVEVWQGEVNDRDAAMLVRTVGDTYYDSAALTVGATYYVWTRRVNEFGIAGAWSSDKTAGHAVTIAGVQMGAVVSNVEKDFKINASRSDVAVTAYNSWQRLGSVPLDASSTSSGIEATIFGWLGAKVTAISGTPTGDISLRVRLKRTSDGEYMHGFESRYMVGRIASGTASVLPFLNYNQTIRFGSGGGLPKELYALEIDVQKGRAAAGLTYTLMLDFGLSAVGRVIAA